MLEFLVQNQTISRLDRNTIVANSTDYLEATFHFTNDWIGISKTAIFKSGANTVSIILEDNQITQDKHLNLTVGTWTVNVYGVLGTKEIITNTVAINVIDSGVNSGDFPPEPTPDVYDQIITMLTNITNLLSVDIVGGTIVQRDTSGSIKANSLQLSSDPTVTAPSIGEFYYNEAEFVPNFQTIDGVSLQICSENVRPVNNATASTIADGTILAWTSTDGNSGNYNVVPYIANGSIENERIVGVATHNIEAGTSGLATFWGKVRGINTTGSDVGETWTNGTILYAHPTQAGKFTSVLPLYPNRVTRMGIVINAHASVGTIMIARTNYPLAEQIGVKDIGNYFTSTNIEGILQEIGAALNA